MNQPLIDATNSAVVVSLIEEAKAGGVIIGIFRFDEATRDLVADRLCRREATTRHFRRCYSVCVKADANDYYRVNVIAENMSSTRELG